MPVSQNGWPAFPAATDTLVNFPKVTGRVRKGDVFTVLEWYATQYEKRVEPIKRAWSWGYAFRVVRAGYSLSNHASGTALDFNAPKYALGVAPEKVMSAAKIKAIRAIIAETGGVLRWGGTYSGRKDVMHVEVNASAAAVAAFAKKIRAGSVGKPTTPAKPSTPTKPTAPAKPKPAVFPAVALAVDGKWDAETIRAYQLMLRDAAGTYKGAIDGKFGALSVKAEQTWLRKLKRYGTGYAIDGKRGKYTTAALKKFLQSKALYRAADGASALTKGVQRYTNTQRKYVRR